MKAPEVRDERLTFPERHELDQLEAKIEKGIKTFAEVGAALMTVRNRRLYRESHRTFEDYMLGRWTFTPQHGNRLIAAAEVVANLEPIGSIPKNEAQARPLAGLPSEQQRGVWTEATANGHKPTAAEVQAIVDRVRREMGHTEPTREEIEEEEAEEMRWDATTTRQDRIEESRKAFKKFVKALPDDARSRIEPHLAAIRDELGRLA